MGGPVIGFCGGRIDFQNGDQSLPLGPSVIQQKFMPCGPEQCPVGEICPGTLRQICQNTCPSFPLSMSRQNPCRLTKSNRYTFPLSLSLSLSIRM